MVTIVDILRRAKANVIVASVEKSLQVLGSQGTTIVADKLLHTSAGTIYDLIVFPVRFCFSLCSLPCSFSFITSMAISNKKKKELWGQLLDIYLLQSDGK